MYKSSKKRYFNTIFSIFLHQNLTKTFLSWKVIMGMILLLLLIRWLPINITAATREYLWFLDFTFRRVLAVLARCWLWWEWLLLYIFWIDFKIFRWFVGNIIRTRWLSELRKRIRRCLRLAQMCSACITTTIAISKFIFLPFLSIRILSFSITRDN